MRHSLGITGIALLVAGGVAFLPLGPTDTSANQSDGSFAAATSLEAMRSVFVAPAEAATGVPPSTDAGAASAAPQGLTAVAPPALEGGVPASAASTPSEAAQAIISSALQQATATPAPARAATAAALATAQARAGVSIPALEDILAQSPWPRDLWPTVERIIVCESSGNPGAVSPAGYVGLMQVAPWLHGTVPADPVAQLAQAYDVYLRQGWGAWGCY